MKQKPKKKMQRRTPLQKMYDKLTKMGLPPPEQKLEIFVENSGSPVFQTSVTYGAADQLTL